ncbi:MAG: tetracycline resistance MFS efflux pump [Exiguobacterium sp.]|uniref:Tetracycline resistance MFS efflux pump n=1 Tax=Exiguobacterium alkaliphilum TaxID=1428684 RepID=A0ABT2KYI5_9BACL|nr:MULTISPECIES: tetracycline resistance MFS efflux pump [Exiguobacterium]MDX5322700.1 tetracycline resistance MFS efflux pump [Exiguobacterium sp.]KDN59492.1 multidrug transporter [Exiguobacterium sp. AB2]MCT4794671.1 tetracycline resistance MFS efflux pump [Exiguobacterium alkaliphilum]MDX5424441.1 tetracycline resistance MFS efflux pump [Exiguobacterium sp.]MDX6771945.1 tetracycline resistance MFS efflux pump [Exiguobacterium sp.]
MTKKQNKQLAILMLNMFIAVAGFGIIIPIIPDYLKMIGEGGTAAGLMISVFAGAQLLMSPVAGKWADVYGRRPMIIAGLIGFTISMGVFYLSDNLTVLLISRAIGGVGAALLIPAIFAYVADITTLKQRAKGNSYISAAMSLGIVIGPGIGGFFAEFGLKAPLLLSAIVSFVAVISSIILLKEPDREIVPVTSDTESLPRQLISSTRKPYFFVLVINLVMAFGLMAYESVLGLFVSETFSATPQQIAVMITGTGIVSVIVQLFAVDRLVSLFGEIKVVLIFILLAALGFLFSLFAGSYAIFFAVTLIIFLSTSILRPVLNTLVSKMADKEQGFAMGMNNAYMSIGNIVGPTLAGIAFDIDMRYPFIMGLVLLLITFGGTLNWTRRKQVATFEQ